ncbi:hypothetical protein MASR1M50_13630 [Burkholderiales bacterium]
MKLRLSTAVHCTSKLRMPSRAQSPRGSTVRRLGCQTMPPRRSAGALQALPLADQGSRAAPSRRRRVQDEDPAEGADGMPATGKRSCRHGALELGPSIVIAFFDHARTRRGHAS